MSDEYQPNEVVESQPEPDMMPAEPAKAEAATDNVAPEAPSPGPEEPVAEPSPPIVTDGAETSAVADAVESEPDLPDFGETTPVEATLDEEAFAEVKLADPASTEQAPAEQAPAEQSFSLSDLPDEQFAEEDEGGGTGRNVVADIVSLIVKHRVIAGAVAAVLLVLILFLPPISLGQRLGGGGGYTVLNDKTTSVEHPDGLLVSRAGDAAQKVRLKLGSIPRADFVAGSVPEEVAGAVQALPAYLAPKSPYYTVDVKAKDPVPSVMSVVIPNEAEPWETLDLYAWDGEAWRWVPSELDRTAETLVATVETLPTSLMVMQNEVTALHVAAEADAWPDANAEVAPAEVDVAGVLIGTLGGTTGNAEALPPAAEGATTAIVPMVRNWLPERDPNWPLVRDMLQSDRSAHVANLVSLAQGGGYAGLVVDYRNADPGDRALYSLFVRELQTAFDEAGLWLAVVVETPQRAEDGSWNTGGYDWKALGAAADQLRVVMPLLPEVYKPGGEADALIQWATTQVERHKLMPVYSTLTTTGKEPCGLDPVLASLGSVQVTETLTDSVEPGTLLNLSLAGTLAMETDPETSATRVTVGESDYWLGTPQWLGTRIDLAARYRLGGVVLRDLFDERNLEGLQPALAAYLADGVAGSTAVPDVVWAVTDPQGKVAETKTALSQPTLAWTAPEITGTYHIAAMVASVDKGALDVLVAQTPVVTETIAEGEAGTSTNIGSEVDDEEDPEEVETAEGFRAAFVADVTVPDNTRFEKEEAFTKTWRMRNAGGEDWPEDTAIVYAGGAELGKEKEVTVGAVEVGDTVDIEVDMVAPAEDGSYRSTWELRVDGKAIAGGAAYVLIQVGEPATATPPATEQPADQPAAPPPPVQPVASGSFELGGHIRDLGIPYREKMHYSGMNWVKIQVFYGQGADGAIAAAHAGGFKIQLSAIGGASMVTQPGFEDQFASWVAGLAASGADAIEVWNEPNIDREWAIGHISPQAYTNLLCKSYNAIKGANGGTAVISAAPAPTGWFGGCGPNGCDDKPWMEGLYNAGAANCMDYIGAHHNAGATSPSARVGHPANPGDTHHSWFFLPQTELYYNTFRGTRKLFYTEMGYASQEGLPTFSDQFAWARGTNNAQQAAWLAEAVQLSVNTGMVRCIIVWNIDFVRYGTDPQDGFAIIRPGGGCPACDSLHNVLGNR